MGITDILGAIKELVGIAQNLNNLDLKRKVLDLQGEILQLVADQQSTVAELAERDKQIKDLQETLSFKTKLVHHHQCYYEIGDNGKPTGGAYCPHCWEVDKVAVHLINTADGKGDRCLRCKGTLGVNPTYGSDKRQ